LDGDLNGRTIQVTIPDDRANALLEFCKTPKTREEMQNHIGILSRDHFRRSILKPLLDSGVLQMTIPDKPNSRNQRYVKTK
jgi:ATP-dependent DNA helicase RecG